MTNDNHNINENSNRPMSALHTSIHNLVHCYGEDLEEKIQTVTKNLALCVNAAACQLQMDVLMMPSSNNNRSDEESATIRSSSSCVRHNGVVVLPPPSTVLMIRAVVLVHEKLQGFIKDHGKADVSNHLLEVIVEFLSSVFVHIEEDVVYTCLRVTGEFNGGLDRRNLIDVLVLFMKQQDLEEQKNGFFEQDDSNCFSMMTQGSSLSSSDIVSRLFCTICGAVFSGVYLSRRCLGFSYSPRSACKRADDDTKNAIILEFMSFDSIMFICRYALKVLLGCRKDTGNNITTHSILILQYFNHTSLSGKLFQSNDYEKIQAKFVDMFSKGIGNITFHSVLLFGLFISFAKMDGTESFISILSNATYSESVLEYLLDDQVEYGSTLSARLKSIIFLSFFSCDQITAKLNHSKIIETYLETKWTEKLSANLCFNCEGEMSLEYLLHHTLLFHHFFRAFSRKILRKYTLIQPRSDELSNKSCASNKEYRCHLEKSCNVIESLIMLSAHATFSISSSSSALLRCLIDSSIAMDPSNQLFYNALSSVDSKTLLILPSSVIKYKESYSLSSPSMYLDFSATSGANKSSDEIALANKSLKQISFVRCEIHLCLIFDLIGSICANDDITMLMVEHVPDDFITLIEKEILSEYSPVSREDFYRCSTTNQVSRLSNLLFHLSLSALKVLASLSSCTVNDAKLRRRRLSVENKFKDIMRLTYSSDSTQFNGTFLISFALNQGSDIDLLRRVFDLNSIVTSVDQELEIVEAIYADNLIRSRHIMIQDQENKSYASKIEDLQREALNSKQNYDCLCATIERERISSASLARREAMDIAQNHLEGKLEAEEEAMKLKIRIDNMDKSLDIEKSKNKDCEDKLHQIEAKLNYEHEANTLLQEKCSLLSIELEEAQTHLITKQKDLDIKSNETNDLRDKIDEMFGKMFILAETYEETVTEKRALEIEKEDIHQEYSKEIDSLASQNNELDAKVQSMRNLIGDYSEQHESLAMENAKLNAQLRSFNKRSSRLGTSSSSDRNQIYVQNSMHRKCNMRNQSDKSLSRSSSTKSSIESNQTLLMNKQSRKSTFKGISYLNSLGGVPLQGKENDSRCSVKSNRQHVKDTTTRNLSKRNKGSGSSLIQNDCSAIAGDDVEGAELDESSILL